MISLGLVSVKVFWKEGSRERVGPSKRKKKSLSDLGRIAPGGSVIGRLYIVEVMTLYVSVFYSHI